MADRAHAYAYDTEHKKEKLEEALSREQQEYTKESCAGNQEMQRLTYDGLTLTYYRKGGHSASKGRKIKQRR